MKNEIENLGLFYGVTIYNIISKYEDFKQGNYIDLAIKLNNYFNDLERNKKVNSLNITYVMDILLKNDDLRQYIIQNNNTNICKITKAIINKIDFKVLNKNILGEQNNMFISFKNNSLAENKEDIIAFLKNQLYPSTLIYKDLIFLIIDNYILPKKLKNLLVDDWILYFLNTLNVVCYQIDLILNSNRLDLYYATLTILGNIDNKSLLFPISIDKEFNLYEEQTRIINYIYGIFFKGLHNINPYYYIEIPRFFYNNTKNFVSLKYSNYTSEIIKLVMKKLNVSNIIFIFKIATNSFYDFSEHDLKELESIIYKINNINEIQISSQKIDNNKEKLIQLNMEYVQKYCLQHNFKIKDLYYNPNFEIAATQYFLDFFINYNNYDYRFFIKKFNNKYCWHVSLKNNKTYKIELFLEDDFKHIIQAMLND